MTQSSAHDSATLRAVEDLKKTLKNSIVHMDKEDTELMMKEDPGSDEAFKADAMVAQFHN